MPTTAEQDRATPTSASSTDGSSPNSPHRMSPARPATPSAAASTIAAGEAPSWSWGAKRSSSVVTPSRAASAQISPATRRPAAGGGRRTGEPYYEGPARRPPGVLLLSPTGFLAVARAVVALGHDDERGLLAAHLHAGDADGRPAEPVVAVGGGGTRP